MCRRKIFLKICVALWVPRLPSMLRLRPLPRIRSLACFQPVIEELQVHPVPDGYLDYLRLKLPAITDKSWSN